MFVVMRGLQVFGPFPNQEVALRWAQAKWGDGTYFIKQLNPPESDKKS